MKKANHPSSKATLIHTSSSKVFRLPKIDVLCENKENLRPLFVPARVKGAPKMVKFTKIRDRDVEVNPKNPFDVPKSVKLFGTKRKPKKLIPEPFIMGDIHTIVDVDPTFYELIEGRPMRQFIDVKRYLREIKNVTGFRTDAAFSKDRVYAIEDKQGDELQEYKRVSKLFEITTNNFVQCVKESYAEARAVQVEAQKKAVELADMSEKLEELSFQYVGLRNYLSQIGANFETLVYYAKILNSLAPPWWRTKYDNVSNVECMSRICLEKLTDQSKQQPADAKRASMSTLGGYEISLTKYKGTPKLYLKTPKQLVNTFIYFAEQCTNYMKIDAQTSGLRNNLNGALNSMKALFYSTVAEIQDYVEAYDKKIKFYEERGDAYKESFFKLLMGEFQDLYASYDNTKLYTCVQFVNTQVFNNPEDPKDSIVVLMRQLESYYFKLSLELDYLDQDIVKKATNISYARDAKELSDAFKAQRELKEFNILQRTLCNSFEPPRQRTRPKIKWGERKIKENY